MIICKDCGNKVMPEECRNLKVNDPKETFGFRLDQLCDDCFNKRLKDKAKEPIKPEDRSFTKNDIFKIIDDAIAKKDRYVRIFITNETISVDVSPLDDCGWSEDK